MRNAWYLTNATSFSHWPDAEAITLTCIRNGVQIRPTWLWKPCYTLCRMYVFHLNRRNMDWTHAKRRVSSLINRATKLCTVNEIEGRLPTKVAECLGWMLVAEFHCSASKYNSLSPKCCTLSKSNAPGRWVALCRSVMHICRNGSGHVETGSGDSKPMSRWLNQWLYVELNWRYADSHCKKVYLQKRKARKSAVKSV